MRTLYRGLHNISTEEIGRILSEGMESSGKVNFGDEFREKYKEEVGIDINEADKGGLLKAHWDATPKIEGKGGCYLMSCTTDEETAKHFGNHVAKLKVPENRIASSPNEVDEDTLFVECPHDYEKEFTSVRPEISEEYLHSIKGEDGSWYLNEEFGATRDLN